MKTYIYTFIKSGSSFTGSDGALKWIRPRNRVRWFIELQVLISVDSVTGGAHVSNLFSSVVVAEAIVDSVELNLAILP